MYEFELVSKVDPFIKIDPARSVAFQPPNIEWGKKCTPVSQTRWDPLPTGKISRKFVPGEKNTLKFHPHWKTTLNTEPNWKKHLNCGNPHKKQGIYRPRWHLSPSFYPNW